MAVNFENEYVMLPQDRADHINERWEQRPNFTGILI